MKYRRPLLLIAGMALLVVLAVVVPSRFIKQKGKSVGDLAVAQGQIMSYSFLDDSRGLHQYMIRLSGYKATFQIPANFANYFAKARFESDLKKGDLLSVSISTASAEKLISDGPVPVFAVRTKTATYLDEHNTLSVENNRDNANKQVRVSSSLVFPLVAVACVILLIGLAFLIWKVARIISERSRRRKSMTDPGLIAESSKRLKKCLTRSDSEQKSLTAGGSEPKLLTMGDSEQTSGEPPAQPVQTADSSSL